MKYYDIEEVKSYKELLARSVKLFGEKPVFRFKRKMNKKGEKPDIVSITYNEFNDEITYLGTKLNTLDFTNNRVAVIAKDRYEWLSVYMSTLIGDKVIVPLDKGLPHNEIISLCQRSEAEVIFFEDKYKEVMKKVKDEKLSNIKYFINFDLAKDEDGVLSYKEFIKQGKELFDSGDKSYLDIEASTDEMRLMIYTSGTTSRSKAVMLTQSNILSDLMNSVKTIKFNEDESTLALLPFHHTFQAILNLLIFYIGGNICFCDGLKYIQQNLCEYEITMFIAVPLIIESIYKRIMKQVDKEGKTKLVKNMSFVTDVLDKLHIHIKKKVFKDIHKALGGHINLIVSGAASIEPKLLKEFEALGFRVLQGYGLTETSPVIALENDFWNAKKGSVGKPIPGVEVKIIDQDEKGIGEIISRGPNTMLGYYDNEEATKECIDEEGFFHTGDLGYFDDGYLFITGRKKNVIVQKNGKNIYPEEIETLIDHLPGVKQSMIYGRPTNDNDLDIAVKIVYDKNEMKDIIGYDPKENDIHDYFEKQIKVINDNMPIYKHIRDIIVSEEDMILTTTGKVKRHEEIKKILGESK